MGKSTKLIYFAPDVDLSKNEGAKAHTLGEVKYLQKYFDVIFLITQNKYNSKLDTDLYSKVHCFNLPSIIHKPIFRLTIESLLSAFFSIFFRLVGYKYLIERSFRLGGFFSIFFSLLKGNVIYQLNEPIYYERYIMPIQNFLLKIMGKLNITFFGTHESFAYNLPKEKYINGWWGVDPEIIKFSETDVNKQFDLIYVGSAAAWHGLDLIVSTAKELKHLKFLLIVSGELKFEAEFDSDNIFLINNVEISDLYDYYLKSRIGLAIYEKNSELLKKFDYFYSPIKVHEYKAYGLPVIATDIGNLKDLIKDCGILIDNDKDSLKKAIEYLLNNKNIYDSLSDNSRNEIVTKYNWDNIAKWYFEILNKKYNY